MPCGITVTVTNELKTGMRASTVKDRSYDTDIWGWGRALTDFLLVTAIGGFNGVYNNQPPGKGVGDLEERRG